MIFIYSWPPWLIILSELVVVVGLTLIGQTLVRRLVPHGYLAKHNDVTGFVLAIVGVIYAVLLAFVVVVAWEGYNTAESTVRSEAAAASDLYRFIQEYPPGERRILRHEILAYVEIVVKDEWPAMQHGEELPQARDSAERIVEDALNIADSNADRRRLTGESVVTLARTFLDARRARLNINAEGIPATLWTGLILGAMLTIAFTYLFGVENFRLQLIIAGLFSSLIAVMFSMVVILDYPFRGQANVSPEAFQAMVDRLVAGHLQP